VTITFEDGELRRLLWAQTQCSQPALLADSADQTLVYPGWLGTGYKRDIELPSGIFLTLHQYRLNTDLVHICQADSHNCFEFVFALAACNRYNDSLTFEDQQVVLSGPHLPEGRWREFSGQEYVSVDVHFDPPLLTSLTATDDGTQHPALRRLLSGECPHPFSAPTAITPAMQTALWQILRCPYRGLTQQLYLEAKSLELIALLMASMQAPPSASTPLGQEECDRIHQARQILLSNLQTPPSLVELARRVGLNDRKLKQGFRQVLGTTAFGYLTEQRLETARQLLAQQQSVATVAAAVGYTSPTAFSGAFRRRFGMPPKAYQLGQRFEA